jgi:hypothetical protein
VRRGLALLALTVASAGCAAAPPAPDRTELIRRILTSSVQLRSEREGGVRRAASGVVVATDPVARRAWIITVRHFVNPPTTQQVFVRRPGQETVVQGVVAFVSPDRDIALIEVEALDLTPVRFKSTTSLGDEILVVAFPWGQRFTLVRGVVSQIASETGQDRVTGSPRMVDASVSYGSSGGGVFDARTGELIGIVERYRSARVAIPETKDRVLEVPVPGETTLIAVPEISDFLRAAGLASRLR